MRILLFLFSIIYISHTVQAQGEGRNQPAKTGVIYGSVEADNQPLAYASVSLFIHNEDKLVSGLISDDRGHFELKDLPYGKYDLKVTFIGFETFEQNEIILDQNNSIIKLDDLNLSSSSEVLKEVEITSNIPMMEYQIDKKVVNVSKQITSASGSAVDVLQNVPSVQVDATGDVRLRGSSGFLVFIDGRPSPLSGSEALAQMPASNIDKIEIITNPSAKYDPDGASGIINIVTKKNLSEGFSGVINGNVGIDDKYGGDFLLYYRTKKVNYYVGANYNHRYFPGVDSTRRNTSSNDTSYITRANGDSYRLMTTYSVKGGVEIPLAVKDALNLSGEIGNRSHEYGSNLNYREYSLPANSLNTYLSENVHARSGLFYNLNADYEHLFTEENHSIKAQVVYNVYNTNEINNNELILSDGTIDQGQNTSENGPGTELRAKLDYTHPITEKSRIESGLQARLGVYNDTNKVYNLNTVTDEYEFQPLYSNSIKYTRNIYAAYGIYRGELKRFGYQAGIRLEYTDRYIVNLGNDSSASLYRMDYFPSVHFSYNLPKDHQLMVSYSRRIERPRSYYFEPFLTYVDAYNVRRGNPNLLPEYIDSYELGYSKRKNKTLYSLEAYYRMVHNKIERIQSVYSENVILSTFQNVGVEHNLGLEGMISTDIFKWWNIDLLGNLYALRGDYNTGNLNNESTNWNSRLNNTFYIGKNTQIQINGNYTSATVTAQGNQSSNYYMNAAIKQSFLDKRLSLTLQGDDILQTSRRESRTNGTDFSNYQYSRRLSPIVMLNISYRFNNFKVKPERGGDSDGGEF